MPPRKINIIIRCVLQLLLIVHHVDFRIADRWTLALFELLAIAIVASGQLNTHWYARLPIRHRGSRFQMEAGQ